jgi:hypothetical protein
MFLKLAHCVTWELNLKRSLSPRNWVLLDNVPVAQSLKKSTPTMKPNGSSPCSQEPATGLYPKSVVYQGQSAQQFLTTIKQNRHYCVNNSQQYQGQSTQQFLTTIKQNRHYCSVYTTIFNNNKTK